MSGQVMSGVIRTEPNSSKIKHNEEPVRIQMDDFLVSLISHGVTWIVGNWPM